MIYFLSLIISSIIAFLFVRDKFFHIHRQELCNFKKCGKVGLRTVAYVSIDRTETPS